MTERPIIFNAEMVRAILNGRKTQTRRIVNWRGVNEGLNLQFSGLRACEEPNGWVIESNTRTSSEWRCQPTPCPFGAVGDRLWVRETWSDVNSEGCSAVAYRADSDIRLLAEMETFRDEGGELNTADPRLEKYWFAAWSSDLFSGTEGSWRPSIHMPRWASRIMLEIIGMRVERLQDISQADAIAEGAPPSHPSIDTVSSDYGFSDFSRSWFGQTWWSIYGQESWLANPWVWVIEFKHIGGGAA